MRLLSNKTIWTEKKIESSDQKILLYDAVQKKKYNGVYENNNKKKHRNNPL